MLIFALAADRSMLLCCFAALLLCCFAALAAAARITVLLFDAPEIGVVIADERSGLRLCRLGEANELGYPTLIEVLAGPFSGVIRDDTVTGFQSFVEQLEILYETLCGTAELNSYEGFRLSMAGGGRGAIGVSVAVIGEHVPPIKLTFEFGFDQTYLPGIIRALRREFADDGYRRGKSRS